MAPVTYDTASLRKTGGEFIELSQILLGIENNLGLLKITPGSFPIAKQLQQLFLEKKEDFGDNIKLLRGFFYDAGLQMYKIADRYDDGAYDNEDDIKVLDEFIDGIKTILPGVEKVIPIPAEEYYKYDPTYSPDDSPDSPETDE